MPSPHGFPLWVRYCHFFNFLFVMLLIRSGLSILMDHPRLYFNDDCTPGSEWIRFTPIAVPRDRLWTAKDDARYISPLVATPGYRHTVGIARAWHFINVHGFIITGIIFAIAALRDRPMEADRPDVAGRARPGLEHLGPLRHVSPAARAERVLWLQRAAADRVLLGVLRVRAGRDPDRHRDVSGGREPLSRLRAAVRRPAVRPLHSFPDDGRLSSAFLVVHVTLVVMTGFARNMNHIVMGTDDTSTSGMIWGFVGIGSRDGELDRGPLPLLDASASASTRGESRDLPDAVAHVEPAESASTLSRPRHLAVLLAERETPSASGLEDARRRAGFGITGSRWAASSNTRSSSPLLICGGLDSSNTSRCITASKDGPASRSGAACRWRS